MTRWKVGRRCTDTGVLLLGWKAYTEPATIYPFYCDTHAEALAYADRMARTVEVELPAKVLVWESGFEEKDTEYICDRCGTMSPNQYPHDINHTVAPGRDTCTFQEAARRSLIRAFENDQCQIPVRVAAARELRLNVDAIIAEARSEGL